MRIHWQLFHFSSNPYWHRLAWAPRYISEARQIVRCKNTRIRRQLFNFSLNSFWRRLAWLPMIRLQEVLRSEARCWCWIWEFIGIDSISLKPLLVSLGLAPQDTSLRVKCETLGMRSLAVIQFQLEPLLALLGLAH